jgi:predicted phage gp36 major capsid-like protein
MAQKSLEERVDMLERRVEILEQLPDRVAAVEQQIVQLRDEMRAEFSATRAEARAGDERVIQTLREEIRAGDEETRRFMRILHEDLVARIEILGEQH